MTWEEYTALKNKRLQIELEIKQCELLLKQAEVKNGSKPKKHISIEQATIIVAVIGFIGSFLGTFLQGINAQDQKQQEFEANLITKAVETGNSTQSKENLRFLVDAGLIEKSKSRIKNILRDSTYEINWISKFNIGDTLKTKDIEFFVDKICSVMGLRPNFILRPSDSTESVIAYTDSSKRMILYDPAWISKITRNTQTNWSIVIPLAHECAHHILGHTTNSTDLSFVAIRKQEMEADEWAGYVSAKLGATLEESVSIYKSLSRPDKEDEYSFLPTLTSRINAVKQGWERGKSVH